MKATKLLIKAQLQIAIRLSQLFTQPIRTIKNNPKCKQNPHRQFPQFGRGCCGILWGNLRLQIYWIENKLCSKSKNCRRFFNLFGLNLFFTDAPCCREGAGMNGTLSLMGLFRLTASLLSNLEFWPEVSFYLRIPKVNRDK